MTRAEFGLLLAMQFGRYPKAQPRKEDERVFPVFHGKIRELTRSKLDLEVEDGNRMELRVQKGTRFYKGTQAAKPSAFKAGDEVAVEAKHAPDASLDAISVRAK